MFNELTIGKPRPERPKSVDEAGQSKAGRLERIDTLPLESRHIIIEML